MPAWLVIILQVLPAIDQLIKTIADLLKSNPPHPTASIEVMACHANACSHLDAMAQHLDQAALHLGSLKE